MVFLGGYFYFVRHGETDYNVRNVVTGDGDPSLNSTGITQALRCIALIKDLQISTCLTSSLSRAVDTSKIILSDRPHVDIIPLDDLHERRWGTLQGVEKGLLDNFDFHEHGVELWDAYVRRTCTTLKLYNHLNPPLLIVAHSGTFRALCEELEIKVKKKPVANAYPYKFYQDNNSWHVIQL